MYIPLIYIYILPSSKTIETLAVDVKDRIIMSSLMLLVIY